MNLNYIKHKIANLININKIVTIHYYEFNKNFSYDGESHNFWEMVYVDNGRINAITNGVGLTLEEGQAIFHEPMEVHAHISDNRVANNMLVISFSSDSKEMKYFKNKTADFFKADNCRY